MAHPTRDAVIRFEPDGFDLTGPRLMGRQSAGNGFLRAAVEGRGEGAVYGYTPRQSSANRFGEMVRAFDPAAEPVWIPGERIDQISSTRGVLFLADPTLVPFARVRQRIGPARYSLCGVTHTLATSGTLQTIADTLSEAVMPWDALICTSSAALEAALQVLGTQADFLRWRFGPQIPLRFPQLPIIPLGVHCADFTFTPNDRAAARQVLGLADDEVAALYVGRLLFAGKAHPFPMFDALQTAAKRTGKKVVLVLCGRAATPEMSEAFLHGAAAYAPDVRVVSVDSRDDAARRHAWAGGDIFVSLADSIQETFGLTPVEAMAAGLPVVVTDWNGYKDTVRDAVDGFRITTWAPEPNTSGAAYAMRQELGMLDYDNFCWAAAVSTSVDLDQLTDRLIALVEQPDLRRRMGQAGHARARELYDWRHVFRQHQALWGELDARRVAAAANPDETAWVRATPKTASSRADPFESFGHYPTHRIGPQTLVTLRPGATFETYLQRSADGLFHQAGAPEAISRPIWDTLERSPATVETLAAAANLSLGWAIGVLGAMAKMGMVQLAAAGEMQAG